MSLYNVWVADIENENDAFEIEAQDAESAAEEYAADLYADGGGFSEITCCVDSERNRFVVRIIHAPSFWASKVR